MEGIRDPVPFLQVLAHRIRTGAASRSGQPVRADRVRDEIYAVGKAFAHLGLPDPRLTVGGALDPRLSSLFRAYTNADPPPNRVKPIPIQVLHRATALAAVAPTPQIAAAIDMAWLAFFFLLRPGEYCSSRDGAPLRLCDVAFTRGATRLDTLTSPLHEIAQATHVTLTFDQQKNRHRGEVIAHGRSGHPFACPTQALARRVAYLRLHHATPQTPLSTVFLPRPTVVPSSLLTTMLQEATTLSSNLGYGASDVSARSLRAGGAMALLCGRVDADTIRLVGRWQSDTMFRYLHAQALPIIRDLANTMVLHGNFVLLPDSGLPAAAAALLLPTTTIDR